MDLSIFAKTFVRPNIEATFAAIAEYGFTSTQWNMSCAGLSSMPDEIDPALIERIRFAASDTDVRIISLSATFNMAHPDPAIVREGLSRLRVLAHAAADLEIPILTLCTGTRCRTDIWTDHPDNRSPDAWSDLVTAMILALEIAREFDLILGIEPEPANIVANAFDASCLLDSLASDRAGVIFDPANLIQGVPAAAVESTLAEAATLLSDRTILLHGKDRDPSGWIAPAGMGVVPWTTLLPRFSASRPMPPLILHGLDEANTKGAADHLRHARANVTSLSE